MQKADPNATRRVPLKFEKDGTPSYVSTQSSEEFKQTALCLHIPNNVIPIIFVPGIMGANIRMKKNKTSAWTPPNGKLAGLGEAVVRTAQSPSSRQETFNPEQTEVNPDGPCKPASDFYMLDVNEAKRRGWGALHADSYLKFLQQLEVSLNEQYYMPGQCNHPQFGMREEIGALTEFGTSDSGEQATEKGKPNYKQAAAAASRVWGMTPPKISAEEISRLDDYYYPVWVHGYNWLQSNEQSAAGLLAKIAEIKAFYTDHKYFHFGGKVILISHSMGGFVTRRAAQLSPDDILGIVHGVQPVAGAPVVYRRFRAGTEVDAWYDIPGAAAATIIGWGAEDITPALACAPGPLELLPTKHYPPGWLKFTAGKDEHNVMEALPVADPYEEIYSKSTEDCWWGMIDPGLIDPSGRISVVRPPIKTYKDALQNARQFHDTLDLYAHPETYGYYGIDEKKFPAFGEISWNSKDNISLQQAANLFSEHSGHHSTTGDATVSLADQTITKFKLKNDKNQSGDGTVPKDSGAVLEKLRPTPKSIFKMSGYNHQLSFDNKYSLLSTIYGLAKLIQLAKPAKN